MQTYDELQQSKSKEKTIAKKVYENDTRYYTQLFESCNSDTLKETQEFRISYDYLASKNKAMHYLLPSGIHIYKNTYNNAVIVSGEEIPLSQIIKHALSSKGEHNSIIGSYVEVTSDNMTYVTYLGGKDYPKKFSVHYNNYEKQYSLFGYYDLRQLPDDAESAIDIINSPSFKTYYYGLSDGDKDLAQSRFAKIFSQLDREDLEHYSDEEIMIMQLRRQKEGLETDLETAKSSAAEEAQKLTAQNAQLQGENEALRTENTTLKAKIAKLKAKIKALKEFILRLGKTPIVGKQILREFDEQLGIGLNDPEDPEDPDQ